MKQLITTASMSKAVFNIVLSLIVCSTAHSQQLSEDQIVNALKPVPQQPTRTRSMRNLSVEQTGQDMPNKGEPPSLSLTIGFEFNSDKLNPESGATLDTLAKALNSDQLKELSFRIEGHTDAKGKQDYNLKLSKMRAEAVKVYLQKSGVTSDRMVTEGKGDTELVNKEDKFAAENRRVHIVTLVQK